MVNTNKLRGKMVERGVSMEQVAVAIGVDKSAIYRKINAEGKIYQLKKQRLWQKNLAFHTRK